MLPLQIIIILAILFLLVVCCMIATQLAPGQMRVPEKAHTGVLELAEVHYQDSRQTEWSTQKASPISVKPSATVVEVREDVGALHLGTLSGKMKVGGNVVALKVIGEPTPAKPKGASRGNGK